MQKLHLVGFTADFDGLIFSTRKGAKSGSFVVPLDGRLMKQIAEAERMRGGGTARVEEHRLNSPRLVRPESALNPREMQDRIRSGWTLDEVAAEAGVDLDWVRRFAAPVLAEVGRVVERSRQAVYDKPRFGLSSLPLGASVRRNVLERGVRLLDEEVEEAWSAYQLDEDVWVVRFAYTSRGRVQEAEWLYDVETEDLSSHNRLAAQLGHVVPRRKRSTNPAPISAVPKPSKATTKAARAAARPPAPRPASRPGPKPSAKPVAKRASTPRKVAAVKKAAVKKAVVKRTAVKQAVARPTPAPPARRATTNGMAPAPRPAPRPTPPRPAPAGRTAAPRKKAASRPTKKPAKETAATLVEGPFEPRPSFVPAPTPPPEPLPERRPEPRPMAEPEPTGPPEPTDESEPEPMPQRDWNTDPGGIPPWTPPEEAPRSLPAPGPAPVPEAVRQAVATPIGEELEPPLPGAVEVDEEAGIARIDSRRNSHYVSGPPPRTPVFRGDVSRAGPPEAPRRPRRTEPLRGR